MLKDAQIENERLRLQVEHYDKHAQARLEGAEGKIRFLEQENVSVVTTVQI